VWVGRGSDGGAAVGLRWGCGLVGAGREAAGERNEVSGG